MLHLSTAVCRRSTAICWINVIRIAEICLSNEILWKFLSARSILHARRIRIFVSTWSMNHVLEHQIVECFPSFHFLLVFGVLFSKCFLSRSACVSWKSFRFFRFDWQLGRNESVDFMRLLEIIIEHQQNVRMRKTSVLEFDNVHTRDASSEDAVFFQFFKKLSELQIEYSCDYIWSVCRKHTKHA